MNGRKSGFFSQRSKNGQLWVQDEENGFCHCTATFGEFWVSPHQHHLSASLSLLHLSFKVTKYISKSIRDSDYGTKQSALLESSSIRQFLVPHGRASTLCAEFCTSFSASSLSSKWVRDRANSFSINLGQTLSVATCSAVYFYVRV